MTAFPERTTRWLACVTSASGFWKKVRRWARSAASARDSTDVPAVSNGRIYLRGFAALYAIAQTPTPH